MAPLSCWMINLCTLVMWLATDTVAWHLYRSLGDVYEILLDIAISHATERNRIGQLYSRVVSAVPWAGTGLPVPKLEMNIVLNVKHDMSERCITNIRTIWYERTSK